VQSIPIPQRGFALFIIYSDKYLFFVENLFSILLIKLNPILVYQYPNRLFKKKGVCNTK